MRQRLHTRVRAPAPLPQVTTRAEPSVAQAPMEHVAAPDIGNQQWLERVGIRPKLTVSQPDDPDEREADEVADAFVAGRPIHRKCAGCATDDESAMVRLKHDGGNLAIQRLATQSAARLPAPRSVERTLASAGSPLERSLRIEMGRRFGADFSDVRLHEGAAANASASAIGARAYTFGRDIVFASGQFAPSTEDGRRLLAHELTHVQQSGERASGSGRTVQRDGGFDPYPDPADLIDAYWVEMFADEFDNIAARIRVAMTLHPHPARYLIEIFEAFQKHSEWEDSVAAALTSLLLEDDLDKLAADFEGRYALTLMYVAMVTGSVTDFEREQSTRVLFAKARAYSPEEFTEFTRHRPGGKLPTRIFPVRFMRVFGGAYAPPLAELQDNGMLRVSYPQNVTYSGEFKRELNTIYEFIGGKGAEINPNEIVIIKDYEHGGIETPLPALALVDYSNQAIHSTFGKIVQVSAFAATLGISSGAAAAGEVAGEEAVAFTATAIWGARIVQAVKILDVAANVIGVAAFVIDENRDWIIEKLGKWGERLVHFAEVANTVASIYGVGRLAQAGYRFAKDFRNAAATARANAKGLNNAEASVINEIDDKLTKLSREIDEEAAAAKQAEGANAPKQEPEPTPHDEPVPHEPVKKPASDAEAIRASASAHGLRPETLQNEVADMRGQLADPDTVMVPDDPAYDVELVTERSGEPHQFLRDRGQRTWCRHSDGACDLDLGNKFNKQVDDAAKKAEAPSPHPAVPPAPTHTRTPFDMNRIGAPTETPQMLGTDLSNVKLKPGQDALYILRDSEGNVLKVGKTSELAAKGRFSVYKRAGKLTNKTIEVEVYPLDMSLATKNAEFYEAKLRSAMEADGQAMPWDNTNQRLGYEGFGTPGEGVRTARVTQERMTQLLEECNGDRKCVGAALGIHPRTVALWAKSLGLKTTDFKK